ncbi:MAG: DUF2017 family protein [Desertimonas sp.]
MTRARGGYLLHLGADERSVVARLLGELRQLVTDGDADGPALRRLFPVVHRDDPEQEAEYQRLMRDELVSSRIAMVDRLVELLGQPGRKVPLDEAGLIDLMQALNSVRLVLGTMLDVNEDDEPEPDDATPEYALYASLSWMLDACVQAANSG